MTTLFLRDDDVGPLDDAVQQFARLFLDRGIPVSYQVIPDRLSDESAAWLRSLVADFPDLVDLGQHGHTHSMQVGGRTVWHEFGPERSLDEQRAVIRAGRERMDALLGAAWTGSLFTPPRHRFNRDTLVALAEAGFSVISGSCYAGAGHRMAYGMGRTLGLTNLGRGAVSWHGAMRPEAPLFELSISVAVDHGAPLARRVGDVLAELAAAQRHHPVVGLMFHHQAWAGGSGADFLARLADAMVALPDVTFALPTAIAGRMAKAEAA